MLDQLTIALSNYVQIQAGILGVFVIELLYHCPQFYANGSLVGHIAKWVCHIGETSACRLVHIQQVGKGVPT